MSPVARTPMVTLVARALRLRCPRCGRGKLFSGWFRMLPSCESCGLQLQREPGYYLGSIYFNYGVTAVVVLVVYFACYFSRAVDMDLLVAGLAAFCFLFPLWFFRYARALWLAFDERWDPQDRDDRAA